MGTIHITLSMWHIWYFSRASAEYQQNWSLCLLNFLLIGVCFSCRFRSSLRIIRSKKQPQSIFFFLRSSDVRANDYSAVGHWRIHELKLSSYRWEIWATAANELIKKQQQCARQTQGGNWQWIPDTGACVLCEVARFRPCLGGGSFNGPIDTPEVFFTHQAYAVTLINGSSIGCRFTYCLLGVNFWSFKHCLAHCIKSISSFTAQIFLD